MAKLKIEAVTVTALLVIEQPGPATPTSGVDVLDIISNRALTAGAAAHPPFTATRRKSNPGRVEGSAFTSLERVSE